MIQTGELMEKEIIMKNSRTYLMRIAPYLRQNKTVDGIVVNFVDISDVKKLNNIINGGYLIALQAAL